MDNYTWSIAVNLPAEAQMQGVQWQGSSKVPPGTPENDVIKGIFEYWLGTRPELQRYKHGMTYTVDLNKA